jgi:hypothetical protein
MRRSAITRQASVVMVEIEEIFYSFFYSEKTNFLTADSGKM